MNISLFLQPFKVVSWDHFGANAPAKSIALDGYVAGPLRRTATHINFNHHEDVDRIGTRCSSLQVMVALKGGLLEWLAGETPNVFANDCDHDVCLATWLPEHRLEFVNERSEPLISRMSWAVDMLDTFAGAYPLDPAEEIYEQVSWSFASYSRARQNGTLHIMNADGMRGIILDCQARMDKYRLGKAERQRADTRFNIVHSGNGWVLVEEHGIDARSAMRAKSIDGFVRIRESNGKTVVSVGKLKPLSRFPVKPILVALNLAEGIADAQADRYDGSDTIGGSPRRRGCGLTKSQLIQVVDTVVRQT